jgi:hypothetical protein
MHRRSSKVIRALLLATATALLPLCCAAQAAPAGTQAPIPSRLDLFGGYTYYHPINTFGAFGNSLDGVHLRAHRSREESPASPPTSAPTLGWRSRAPPRPTAPTTAPTSPRAASSSAPRSGRLVPFAAHLGRRRPRRWPPRPSPAPGDMAPPSAPASITSLPPGSCATASPSAPSRPTWSTPTSTLALNTAPTFFNGGMSPRSPPTGSAPAASSGWAAGSTEVLPASYGCDRAARHRLSQATPSPSPEASSTSSPARELKPVRTWATSGGQIEGDRRNRRGHHRRPRARRLRRHRPRQRRQQAHPARRVRRQLPCPGLRSAHHRLLRQPQQHPPRRSLHHHRRGPQPAEPPAQLLLRRHRRPDSAATRPPPPSPPPTSARAPSTVTCNVVDDLGKTATSTTTVTVVAPPPPPAPSLRAASAASPSIATASGPSASTTRPRDASTTSPWS